jgi:hypothetical protein
VATFTFSRVGELGIIEVDLPFTVATIQEIHDAARAFEANQMELDDPILVSAGGKEDLGGGNAVAVTLSILNGWRIRFAARAGPAYVACKITGGNLVRADPIPGTATSNDAGTVLTDTNAMFASDGILEGDVLTNVDDGSTASVLTVDSETQMTHTALTGGSENDWDIGEAYSVVATNPLSPSAFTQIQYAQSTSPLNIDGATSSFVDALLATTVDGTTFEDILQDLLAMANARIVESPTGTFTFYERDNVTVRYTLTRAGSERTRS